jgi:hypothetical protein
MCVGVNFKFCVGVNFKFAKTLGGVFLILSHHRKILPFLLNNDRSLKRAAKL